MITIRPLDAVDALGLVPRLCSRHREELLRTEPDLRAWALTRVQLPGPQWALEVDGQVMVIGGVIDKTDFASVWLAGALGWERFVRPLFKVWREIRRAYPALRCKVYADNFPARRFAEHAGFEPLFVKDNFVHYGTTPC